MYPILTFLVKIYIKYNIFLICQCLLGIVPLSMTEPTLTFTEEKLEALVRRLSTEQTLIVTDDYNYPALHEIAPTVLVRDQEIDEVEKTLSEYSYESVIAVGGCTALDFGRACAKGKELVLIPTILSNSCISVNRSVIKRQGVYKSEQTTTPKNTMISMPTIADNHGDQVKNWSASGFGDLFAGLSASVEIEYDKNNKSLLGVTTKHIENNIPTCVNALEWVVTTFTHFDRLSLEILAHYLHESSLDVIRNGHARLSAASEHWLYYKMQERHNYPKMLATHGKMVSIGNLITARILGEATSDLTLYKKLVLAHEKLGLPLTYTDLLSIRIKKEDIIQGIQDIQGRECMYANYFATGDYSILDRIFN